jgi:hypothetical protein
VFDAYVVLVFCSILSVLSGPALFIAVPNALSFFFSLFALVDISLPPPYLRVFLLLLLFSFILCVCVSLSLLLV